MFIKVMQYDYKTFQNAEPALKSHITKKNNLELNLSESLTRVQICTL